ncbi:hypothetical protein [Hyalangium rubrum]|uniref:Lipoprotein n=1 Tax=Hyalangium rubrum TaxID=3103134 RepID=A0ABU5H940_9BACT|nr:hypothetical protein [Hyalangium sp. s54d21]MDY7229363.1 hypothetical protein [Hyalangium sp. s54d21]
MNILVGAGKGASLGILYAVVATPPFALVYFKGWMSELLQLVALCAVPAGALVGISVIVTGAYQRGGAWRAQLGMLGVYALTGIVFFHGLHEGLGAAVMFAPVFLPLAMLATWVAVLWIRKSGRLLKS